jgi:hypothetical protein
MDGELTPSSSLPTQSTISERHRRMTTSGNDTIDRYADRNPEVDTGPHLLANRDRVTPEDNAWPIQLYPHPDSGPLHTFAYSCAPYLTPETIQRLELNPDEPMYERVIVATTEHGLPILSSHSYVPSYLAENDHWRETHIGQLALPGIEVQPVHDRALTHYARVTTSIEADALAIPDTAPMNLLYYRVTINQPPHPIRAGLLIRAPGHRTYRGCPPARRL